MHELFSYNLGIVQPIDEHPVHIKAPPISNINTE